MWVIYLRRGIKTLHGLLSLPAVVFLLEKSRQYEDPLGRALYAKIRCHYQAFIRRLQARGLFYRYQPLKI